MSVLTATIADCLLKVTLCFSFYGQLVDWPGLTKTQKHLFWLKKASFIVDVFDDSGGHRIGTFVHSRINHQTY